MEGFKYQNKVLSEYITLQSHAAENSIGITDITYCDFM